MFKSVIVPLSATVNAPVDTLSPLIEKLEPGYSVPGMIGGSLG